MVAMSVTQPVKGTRDFYPEDMAFRNWLYRQIRDVSEGFGYQEFEAPFLERLELYAAKSGEELVKEQAFVFPDRSGDLIALRPELTLGLARMIAARSKTLGTPIRWWSFGPFWRYERPQKGRTREFFQWNIDLLGPESPVADAEIASIGAAFFRRVGLGPDVIRILVNDRRLAEAGLQRLGLPPDRRTEIFRLIDRRDKLESPVWEKLAYEAGLSAAQLNGLQQMLGNHEAWKESPELTIFFDAVNALGCEDYVSFDPTVIRGLDYYTGVVFEARDRRGEYRAILGGGRYDNLVADVGGDRIGGTGFAMGDVVVGLVLSTYGARPALPVSPAQVLVACFDEATQRDALTLSQELRQGALRVELYPEAGRLARQYKYADRQGIAFVALVGPDELEAGKVVLKEMASGEQQTVDRPVAAARLREKLGLERS
jgi:histidyl-tRNA synthetase